MRKAAVTIIGFVLSFIAYRVLRKKLTDEIPLGNGEFLDGTESVEVMAILDKVNRLKDKG
ncbi:hypothetical protein [Shimazuella kribbensis]|uniref:hypothetical protein n=1 Tax=Shimazuella kribbensis TaxID=139808 RepID=UPI00041DE7F9|nr:hypothetical protein [Shimazuella kribbensis]